MNVVNGLTCLVGVLGPVLIILSLARQGKRHAGDGPPTRTGVVMGHVYDPMHFRTLDYVISDEGQNRPEIIMVNQAYNPDICLIEGEDGLTLLDIGTQAEKDIHDRTAPLN